MKKKVFLSMCVCLAMVAASCGGSDSNEAVEAQDVSLLSELNDSLITVNAEKDSLIALINDVNQSMREIKEVEKILNSTSFGSESADKRAEMVGDLEAVKKTLEERRKRIASLESKLKKSTANNEALQKTLDDMKLQISEQEATIQSLEKELASAKEQIAGLTVQVDSLTVLSDQERQQKEIAEEEAARLTTELYTCYYALGSKGELKENNIIETGFLRSTKVMESDYNKDYFTVADKRTLTSLPLHSKKAKIMTNHPDASYTIEEDTDGVKTLKITDTEAFWETTSYLVIQID